MLSSLVFQPPGRGFWQPEGLTLTTARGKQINAFYITRNSDVTILFSHGNAEDLGMIHDWFLDFSRFLRCNIFAYDYTGYGESDDTPSEADCYADIDAAFAYLTEDMHLAPSNIILYGRSLGSAVTCYLAEKQASISRPFRGLILQSPLLSIFRVAFHFRFTMPGDMFPSIDRAPFIKETPTLIVHGTRDAVVPFWHGQELFLAFPSEHRVEPLWVEGAGHNNIEISACEVFFDRLKMFINDGV